MKTEPLTEAELVSIHGRGLDELNRNIGRAIGWLTAALQDVATSNRGSNLAMSPTGGWYAYN